MSIRKAQIQSGEIPTLARYELIDKINQLPELRDKSLISFLYLTGCRIEECCKYIMPSKEPKLLVPNSIGIQTNLKGEPIKKKQLEFRDNVIIINNVRCLKRRKKLANRNIPIVCVELEKPFTDIIKQYITTLQDESPLFNITRQRAYQILSQVGLYCHWLRHIRLTHLVVDYGFNSEHLRQFTGWRDSRMASEYVHLNIENLIQKMEGQK